jgi:hypothetical protein
MYGDYHENMAPDVKPEFPPIIGRVQFPNQFGVGYDHKDLLSLVDKNAKHKMTAENVCEGLFP